MPQTISIAMATYNGARYVREQLDSFAAQTRLPDELVVRDDGSSDETTAIVEAFAAEAPFPVRLTQNARNLGLTKNFEAAIEDCSGDLIFLSDQDDVWFPEKLATVEAVFAAHPEAMVVINDAENTDENLHPSGFAKSMHLNALGLGWDGMVVGCCTAFRRAFVPVLCPIRDDGHSLHDAWLHLLAQRLQIRHELPKVLQYHRRHERASVQWFASRRKRLGRFDRLEFIKSRLAEVDHSRRLETLRAIRTQIAASRAVVVAWPGGEGRLQSALESLKKDCSVMEIRRSLLYLSRTARIAPACNLLLNGGYRQAKGWKSFVLDMLAPRLFEAVGESVRSAKP